MKGPLAAGLTLVLMGFTACSGTRPVESQSTRDSFIIEGTMEFLNIETGCWILVTAEGHRFEPSGEIATTLWQEGLLVAVEVRRLKGVSSVCQSGTIVEVLRILETREL